MLPSGEMPWIISTGYLPPVSRVGYNPEPNRLSGESPLVTHNAHNTHLLPNSRYWRELFIGQTLTGPLNTGVHHWIGSVCALNGHTILQPHWNWPCPQLPHTYLVIQISRPLQTTNTLLHTVLSNYRELPGSAGRPTTARLIHWL